jgi:hypothetical protein
MAPLANNDLTQSDAKIIIAEINTNMPDVLEYQMTHTFLTIDNLNIKFNSMATLNIFLYLFTKRNDTNLVKLFIKLGADVNSIAPKH